MYIDIPMQCSTQNHSLLEIGLTVVLPSSGNPSSNAKFKTSVRLDAKWNDISFWNHNMNKFKIQVDFNRNLYWPKQCSFESKSKIHNNREVYQTNCDYYRKNCMQHFTLTLLGTSCRSLALRLGRMTRVMPALCAAITFSLIPPTCKERN